MGAADDHIYFIIRQMLPDMLQRINHAAMGAAEYDHKPLFGFQYGRLVVFERIRNNVSRFFNDQP